MPKSGFTLLFAATLRYFPLQVLTKQPGINLTLDAPKKWLYCLFGLPYMASRKSLEAESFGGKKSYWHVEEAAESTKKPASEAEHQNFSESTIMRWWHKAILCCSPLYSSISFPYSSHLIQQLQQTSCKREPISFVYQLLLSPPLCVASRYFSPYLSKDKA